MNEKIYAKIFNLKGLSNQIKEEEFDLFRVKFETIRALYYNKDINHDCYGSFRSIVKEIKRAAHNAGLEATMVKVDYEIGEDGNILLRNEKDYEFNLVVYFKSAEEYGKKNRFVITKIKCGDYTTHVFKCINISSAGKSYFATNTLIVDNDARDSKDITYTYNVLEEDK